MASSSMRASRSDTAAGSVTAPWRCSSAKPRIEVSGVRSSWLASATNRRMRSSERRARASDAARAPKARSICSSMALSARLSRPISVLGWWSGTRRARSPRPMAAAVSSISVSGRRAVRTIEYPTTARPASTARPTRMSICTSRSTVASTSPRLVASTTVPASFATGSATARHDPPPFAASTVKGCAPRSTASSGVISGRSGSELVSADGITRSVSPSASMTVMWKLLGRGVSGAPGSEARARSPAAASSCSSTRSTR